MKFEFSAGGIIYKRDPSTRFARVAARRAARRASSGQDGILILVAQHSQHHGWVFPKGLTDKKQSATLRLRSGHASNQQSVRETKEEAALREVKEETGVYAKIIKPLTPITYWYAFGGDPSTGSGREKIKKTVYYFLMEYVSGDIKDHDFEMENVEWLPVDKVEDRLTYKSDKKVWRQAYAVIPNLF